MKTFPGRSLRRAAAVGVVAFVGLTACTSDPDSKRVAEDLIKTLAETPEIEQCMLDVLDEYTAGELDDLGKDANEGDLETQAEAKAALAAYEADLEACK